MKARKQALAADVVVVNHHLFFADVMLRDEGLAELLPACNTVIFDEAHQLPETARLFFGETVSTSQLLELARDAEAEALRGREGFRRPARRRRGDGKGGARFPPDCRGREYAHAAGGNNEKREFRRGAGRVAAISSMRWRSCWKARPSAREGLENCWQRAP